MQINILQGDITKVKVDAIVNAANASLLGGGGVDGAIHRAAGRELQEECRTLGGCKTGQCKATRAYKLPCSYIIHAVGPIYNYQENPSELLAECYRNCLEKANELKINSLAFPCISTGAFGFPYKLAAQIAVNEVRSWSKQFPTIVQFVCFEYDDFEEYKKILF